MTHTHTKPVNIYHLQEKSCLSVNISKDIIIIMGLESVSAYEDVIGDLRDP